MGEKREKKEMLNVKRQGKGEGDEEGGRQVRGSSMKVLDSQEETRTTPKERQEAGIRK